MKNSVILLVILSQKKWHAQLSSYTYAVPSVSPALTQHPDDHYSMVLVAIRRKGETEWSKPNNVQNDAHVNKTTN